MRWSLRRYVSDADRLEIRIFPGDPSLLWVSNDKFCGRCPPYLHVYSALIAPGHSTVVVVCNKDTNRPIQGIQGKLSSNPIASDNRNYRRVTSHCSAVTDHKYGVPSFVRGNKIRYHDRSHTDVSTACSKATHREQSDREAPIQWLSTQHFLVSTHIIVVHNVKRGSFCYGHDRTHAAFVFL